MPFDGTRVDEVGRVLLAAADDIEQNGWWDGSDGGKMIGALGHLTNCALLAIDLDHKSPHGAARACNRLERHLGLSRGGVPNWNDEEGRTKEEVVAALRAAALVNG